MRKQRPRQTWKAEVVMNRLALSLTYAALVLALAPMVTQADEVALIDYRQQVMKTLGEQAEALAMTMQQKAPAENFNLHVRALAIASTQALSAFEPKANGGNAKPDIWKN